MDCCDELIDMVSVLGLGAPSAMMFDDGCEWAKTAIVVLPGMYEDWRVEQGVKLWPGSAKYLVVAGTRGDPSYTRQQIIGYAGTSLQNSNVITGEFVEHTKAQMDWVCRVLQKQLTHVNCLIFTTAIYHVPRCVMTFLQAVADCGLRNIVVVVEPLLGDLTSQQIASGLMSEAQKIRQYRQKGDVLATDNLQAYFNWFKGGDVRWTEAG